MDNNTEKQRGFTLVELMVTMSVFAFGLLGLAGLQGKMIHANTFNRDMLIVQTIGADLIEETKVLSFADLGTLSFTDSDNIADSVAYGDINGDGKLDPGDIDINGDGNPDDPYNGRYTWTRTWTLVAPGTEKIDVTVFWMDRFGNPHQQSFQNIVPSPA